MIKEKTEDQDFLDADFSNIMYEKYGKKWTEYQEQEVKRIEEEQLVSIDNVIFEPMPKRILFWLQVTYKILFLFQNSN